MRAGRTKALALMGLGLATAHAGSAVHAETLADAVALAYRTNPTLQQTRAQLRALDESYVQARAGIRPTASLSGGVSYTRTDLGASSGASLVNDGSGNLIPVAGGGRYESNTGQAQLTLAQPLYNGGRTAAAIDAAEASILAGRQNLRQTEANVLQSVIQAYADVRRDQDIVGIRQANVAVLTSQLEETRAKFTVGQLTRTDTAQAQAQLAAARALLTSAQAQLQISRANYTAVVGQNPGELSPSPPLPGLPSDVDRAFEISEADNASLLQARFNEQASRFRIAEARGADRPTVSATASLGYTGTISPFDTRNYDRAITGGVQFTQPLFTGGTNGSLIRQAVEQNTSDRIAIEGARRAVVQTVSQAWNSLLANRANAVSDEEQVNAASVAAEGARVEYRVGLRITLDVLSAEQTLRSAQLSLVQARHDQYVSEAALLAAMGRLEAQALIRGAPAYDPAKAFDHVKRRGSVPWEGAVTALDRLGEASARPAKTIAAPNLATTVDMAPADVPVPRHAAPATTTPTAPQPDTVAPAEPVAE